MQIQFQYLVGSFALWLAIPVSAATLYVDLNSTGATPPFADWTTATTNIQDAIDAANPGDQILVTNGVYQTGGRLISGVSTINRVAVTQAVTVESVNGPAVTAIAGYQVPGTTNGSSAVRCVYLANGAALIGFTLTNGATGQTLDNGGGIWFQTITGSPTTTVVSNCVLTGNSCGYLGGGAYGSGKMINCTFSNNWARADGGGALGSVLVGCLLKGNAAGDAGGGSYGGLLTNCVLVGNSARNNGGGSYGARLINCTIVGNVAGFSGGGVGNSTLLANCIVYFNSAPQNPNYSDSPMVYSCTTPLNTGFGNISNNITNAPLFVDFAGANYHLQSNSPCINAGKNSYIKNSGDLDGSPRIAGGTVDLGAYEFLSPASFLSYAWALQFGLPTDGSADFSDTDGDGMNNWQEWIAGTDPTNSLSVLKMLSASNNPSGLQVSWQSVSGKTYFLQSATNLAAQPAFSTLKSNIPGQAGTTALTDTTTSGGLRFYRVGVQQ